MCCLRNVSSKTCGGLSSIVSSPGGGGAPGSTDNPFLENRNSEMPQDGENVVLQMGGLMKELFEQVKEIKSAPRTPVSMDSDGSGRPGRVFLRPGTGFLPGRGVMEEVPGVVPGAMVTLREPWRSIVVANRGSPFR